MHAQGKPQRRCPQFWGDEYAPTRTGETLRSPLNLKSDKGVLNIVKEKAKENQGGFKGNQYTSGINQKSDKDQKPIITDIKTKHR